MPRKPTLDNPKKEIACALARAGMTGRWIAVFFGVDESTLRYALMHDESFRMRYDQARAYLFLDHLMHIARAASKSWRASAWLLERAFPECNLRHRMPEPDDDSFNHEPPASAEEDTPHQPEAQQHYASASGRVARNEFALHLVSRKPLQGVNYGTRTLDSTV